MEKKEEKELEYLFAHVNRLWAAIMVLSGGLAGILFSIHFDLTFANVAKLVLFLVGAIIWVIMVMGLVNIKFEIEQKLK